MLTDDETKLAMHHCDVVRRTHPVPFLQVRPDPVSAYNVQLRYRRSAWRTMHWTDAVAFTRNARRTRINQRKQPPGSRKAYQAAYAVKRRQQIRQQRQDRIRELLELKGRILDYEVKELLHTHATPPAKGDQT